MAQYPFSDHTLSRRLERAESASNASFVDARSRLSPTVGATWVDFDGTWAMFDGVDSPLTQTFGLGLFTTPVDEHFDAIEHFFASRGSSVYHEVSPLADPTTLALLNARGYRPIELTTVLHRPIDLLLPIGRGASPDIHVRVATAADVEVWAETSAAGWSEYPELGDFMREMASVMATTRNTFCFLAAIDGVIAATAAMSMHDGVALLAGASTVPVFRGRGAQNALLKARLDFAAEHHCDLALMGALPGSASQRNAERQGFHIAYTRTKWGKA
jgi:hypothetical protein